MNGVGVRITEARKTAGLRPEDLASKTGLSFNTVRNYEAGRTQPSLDSLRRIADATGVDVAWLIEEVAA